MGAIRVENVTQERRRESFQEMSERGGKGQRERRERAKESGGDMLFKELAGIWMHFNSMGALILL